MKSGLHSTDEERRIRARDALRRARAYLSDPVASLPRPLSAYAELKAEGKARWALPEA